MLWPVSGPRNICNQNMEDLRIRERWFTTTFLDIASVACKKNQNYKFLFFENEGKGSMKEKVKAFMQMGGGGGV